MYFSTRKDHTKLKNTRILYLFFQDEALQKEHSNLLYSFLSDLRCRFVVRV